MYLYGGITKLVGAGTPAYTRPARSNLEPWQGQKKPPFQLPPPKSAAPTSGRNVGEQPKCVQMPTATQRLGLIERVAFLQFSGCCSAFDLGSANWPSNDGKSFTCCSVRFNTKIGLPRHSAVIICPDSILLMSTSTAAPAAFAFSDGNQLATSGVATPAAATAPAPAVASDRKRRRP